MTSATILSVVPTKVGNVAVWACTVDSSISAEKGDVLVEANEEGTEMLVKEVNAVVDADADMLDAGATSENRFEGARYYYTPALGGIMYTHKMSPMPSCVLAKNESKINGWFQIQSV